jgi:phosphate uptake regulator
MKYIITSILLITSLLSYSQTKSIKLLVNDDNSCIEKIYYSDDKIKYLNVEIFNNAIITTNNGLLHIVIESRDDCNYKVQYLVNLYESDPIILNYTTEIFLETKNE